MEELKTKERWKRKRKHAMQPDEGILKLQEKEGEGEKAAFAEASRDYGRTCAPADYKIFEELIEDPVKEERDRRRRAVAKWTKESNDKFARGLTKYGKRFRKLAEPLPDITVEDCVEHYYMAKPFRFDFDEWRAQEKINDERSLTLSAQDHKGTSSQETQTSSSSSNPEAAPVVSQELKEMAKEKLEEKIEAPATKPVVIEIKDEPDVIVLE